MRHLFYGCCHSLLVLTIALLLYPASPAEAASGAEIDADANAALETFYNQAPTGRELAEKAAGMLIFPSIVKAGMLVGGEYGEGALRINGQSVGYYSTVSGSIGLQIGLQQRSVIIMFMDNTALEDFRASDGWEVGVDGSIALVTIGAGGAINTSTIQQPIIGFVFGQKGFMGNLTLEGTKISKIVR